MSVLPRTVYRRARYLLSLAAVPAFAVGMGLLDAGSASPEARASETRGCRTLPDSLRDARVVDDRDSVGVEVVAYWIRIDSSRAPEAYGGSTLSDEGVRADGVVRFYWPSLEPGRYGVFMCSPALRESVLATNVPVRVRHADGSLRVTLDQRGRAGDWVRLGIVRFERKREAFVEVRNDAADGYVVADAVSFRRIGE